jgi:broad specificity phosphatase PhoE
MGFCQSCEDESHYSSTPRQEGQTTPSNAADAALGTLPDAENLDVYFLRHAETMANVSGETHPADHAVFSANGLLQIEELTTALQGVRFDVILVSPTYRAQQTILPYLQANNLTAEIWPELCECCWRSAEEEAKDPSGTVDVSIERGEEQWFTSRSDANKPPYPSPASIEQGRTGAELVRDRLLAQYSRSGLSVLIVGHNQSGSLLVETLLEERPVNGDRELNNAKFTLLEQTKNQTFRLRYLNRHPADILE